MSPSLESHLGLQCILGSKLFQHLPGAFKYPSSFSGLGTLAREPRGHTGLWERSLLTHSSAGVSFLPASEPAWRQPCPLSQVLPGRQPQTSILIQIFFPFYYFQMFKAMHMRQSHSYAVTCTWLREESSSLYLHSGDPVPMAAGWDCPSPTHADAGTPATATFSILCLCGYSANQIQGQWLCSAEPFVGLLLPGTK